MNLPPSLLGGHGGLLPLVFGRWLAPGLYGRGILFRGVGAGSCVKNAPDMAMLATIAKAYIGLVNIHTGLFFCFWQAGKG